ncbi:hypothetical protein INR49_027751 [Caranx melampygus]|nr:hypothetical protein INR49_027751 [Caranx melampygus]
MMSDSDSDSDYSGEYSRHRVNVRHGTVIALRPSEEIFDRWLRIDANTRREAGQRMRVCTFWLPILLQRDDSSPTACWAIEIGLIAPMDSEDISLKQLQMLEILEAVLRAMERGTTKRDQTKAIISISNMFNLRSPEVLDNALIWLERTGEPDIRYRVMGFGHPLNCLTALHLIFTEFAKYIQDMGANLDRTMKALMARPSEYLIEKSEEMKKKGNDSFNKQQYQEAMKFYSKAIKYYPDNHVLYGNRALCYIRSEMWLKAVSDGKRATLIKPYWPKGHYRYCEALFSLGEVRMAIEANSSAQRLCKDDHEGVKDLEQQQSKFCSVFTIPKVVQPKEKNKRVASANRAEAAAPLQHFTVGLVKNIPKNKVTEAKVEKQKGKSERVAQMKERTKDPKPSKSEVPSKEVKVEPSTTTKKKSKNRNFQSENETEKVTDSKAAVCKELRSAVQDAHTALADLRSRNAEQAFSQALTLLKTTTPKELGLSTVDVLLLLYGRASALTEIGQSEFEAAIPKPQTPKKPKVNQKCTSLKKIKSKEERRLKRKTHKQSFQDKQVINDEILQQKQDSATQSEQKAWLMYRDRVLLQISQNMELLRQEKSLQVSALTGSLRPWLELDSSRGNVLAKRMLNWQQEESLGTFCQAVEVLLERKNRVWARVLLQLISGCLDINPKLKNWACRLNDAGLSAAKSFIERHCEHLEQLDLTVLLSFDPLQEMIIDRLNAKPELISSIGLTVTDYLKQASPHDMRLFIWTLEEHRDDYLSCHTILDEYFDMMDGLCSVLKKSDEDQNNSPMKTKNRSRRKKQKGVFVWTGVRAVTPREESDQDFFEDDSLSFLHPSDPFSVPSHLRDQVADFEDQYNSGRHRGHYKQILDNHPDPAKESLYDYFAQILEEHGPLVAEDPLLVGELENFPQVAQLKIQEAGGFESFLLESLRFIKMGRCIGLARHAVTLQQAGHGASLDDLDIIMDPLSPDLYESAVSSSLDDFSEVTEIYPALPNPYAFSFQPDGGVTVGNEPYPSWSGDDNQQYQAPFFSPGYPWAYSHWSVGDESGDGVMETCSSLDGVATLTAEEDSSRRHTATQTFPESMSSVAVNTELYEPFESCQGDINRKEKSNEMLEQQIKLMENGCDEGNVKLREEINALEEEIQRINVNTQVTNKELAMFQHKLEEEVKKDQKEKKANQEVLKSLKQEIEELVEEHESLARNSQEKKSNYEAKLSDFLELSNQSAAEKMSLEDEINRCKALFTTATRRSLTAQLSVVESNRDQGLFGLYRELNNAKALLAKLDEAVHRFPNQELEMTRNGCRANVQEIEKKISTAETQYKEQIDQTKNGRRVNELTPISINQSEPPAPTEAQLQHKPPPNTGSWVGVAAAAEPQLHSKPRNFSWVEPTYEPPKLPRSTVFNRAMEQLLAIFPDYSRSDLMMLVQELRSSSGGSLSSMGLQDVVGGVTQLILDQQERQKSVRSNMVGRESPAQCATPPLVNPAPVWQPVVPPRTTHPNAINMEDPCIICHEDMSPDDMCVLECRHSFHKECIKSWLKEQSTCPTCRDHALLPDDFPVLPGRRRQVP